jgi:multidrug efflux pump subunit AcrB
LSKQLGTVTLRFADGAVRTSARAAARADIDRAAATLPEDIRREITRERKPGDADAAIDPLAAPNVREAVRNASFELLVGFQLDDQQLLFNVAK